eukprot:2368749-Amphidinium_carterae.1
MATSFHKMDAAVAEAVIIWLCQWWGISKRKMLQSRAFHNESSCCNTHPSTNIVMTPAEYMDKCCCGYCMSLPFQTMTSLSDMLFLRHVLQFF